MRLERPLVWLVALAASAVAVAPFLSGTALPVERVPLDLALVGLGAVLVVPLLFVYGPALVDRGKRGWG